MSDASDPADDPDGPGREYTNAELRQMDDERARQELTVEQYEKREKLISLREQARETREEWAAEAEAVEEITVHADPEDLGVELEIFGNDVLVHIDSGDERFREIAAEVDQALEQSGSDADTDNEETEADADDVEDEDLAADVAALDDDVRETVAEGLIDLLDAALLRWNGHDWDALPASQRIDVLERARDRWGVDGLLLAWLDIVAAVGETRQERVEVIEKFRDPARRGDR